MRAHGPLFCALALIVGCTGSDRPAPAEAPAPAGAASEAVALERSSPVLVAAAAPPVAVVAIASGMNPRRALDAAELALADEPYASGSRATGAAAARTGVRLLMSFEDGADGQPVPELMRFAEAVDVVTVLDNGVTEGRQCARVTGVAGAEWATLSLPGALIADWSDFDYLAVDVFVEDGTPYRIVCDLFDAASVNYHTRCSLEAVSHRGAQTLLFPIGRARRNGKEGLDWRELKPEDKIELDGLRRVKLFFTPPKNRPGVFWMDNIRLLQEDAAKPKLEVPLPAATTAAFDFGSLGAVVPGFAGVAAQTRFTAESDYGFTSLVGGEAGGAGWPDLLSGTFVAGDALRFQARVPDGDYRVWLAAGRTIAPDRLGRRFRLRVQDRVLYDETPDYATFDGVDYLYRFMWTQYSQRPHALWLDYIDRMYPVHTASVTVTGGVLTVEADTGFLGALVLLPAAADADFARMTAKIQRARIAAFEAVTYVPERRSPEPAAADGDYVLYVPDSVAPVQPWSGPTVAARGRASLRDGAAPGQNVFWRLALTPFAELGPCELVLDALQGPGGTIPASAIRCHFVNYRFAGRHLGEMALLPSARLYVERGTTQCFWLWLEVPDDAAPGRYEGAFTFRTSGGAATQVPVTLDVHPFTLEAELPVAYGMYYKGRTEPAPPADRADAVMRAQFAWMHGIGFTSVTVPGGIHVRGANPDAGRVAMAFDPAPFRAARAAGLGAIPEQPLLAAQLPIARAIARRLPGIGGPAIDHEPGLELKQPAMQPLWADAMRQVKEFVQAEGLSVVFEIVDEPREVPNPWNRNLADTLTYGRWMQAAGIPGFVTPMGDVNGGKDYTPLVEVADVVSIHANAGSRRMLERAREAGRTLWFYNIGMDRLGWGFYPWRCGADGRFEWHWCWPDGGAVGGYPGREWYNPFTTQAGMAPNAPLADYPGGFLYQSSLLTAADGITDRRYAYTLERRAAAAARDGLNPEAVRRARALLREIRARIPLLAHHDASKAAAGREDEWRAAIAEVLAEF